MNKKIFDILPPKETPATFPKVVEKEKPKAQAPKLSFQREGSKGKKWVILVSIVIIFIGISCYFTLSKADIEIWPEAESQTFETKLTIDESVSQPDFLTEVIPGEIFETEQEISQEFPSSGKVLKKAEGKIRLYNNYTTKSETWLKGTRFVSAEGKLFKSKSKIFVPGAKLERGKLVPSYTDVEVIASEPGADYNIGPSTFSIYVYRGTSKYTKYWGESSKAMVGGGEASQVTQDDLDQAKKVLTEKITKECQAFLKNETPSEFKLLEDALKTEIIEDSSSAKVGNELETFSFQIKTKSKTLAFKEEDVKNFAKDLILSQISKDKDLYQKSLEINYSLQSIDLDSNQGEMVLNLKLSAKIYSHIALETLKEMLKGKSLGETRIVLNNQPQITKVQVRFWPFWVRKVPENPDKIKIKLNLD